MNPTRIIARSWFYFRTGYATYITFLIGYLTTFVTVYYLAIKSVPDLVNLFPHFATFAIFGIVISVPLSVLVGWLHLKRTPAWAAEMDVSMEANPYNYKLTPGIWREVFTPTFVVLLKQNRRILAANNLLTPEDEQEISKLERDLQTLMKGGFVGKPRRKWIESNPQPRDPKPTQ